MGVEVAGVLGLIGLILIVYAIIKVLKSDASTMVKVLWVVGLLAFPFVGFIAWLLFGPKGRGGL